MGGSTLLHFILLPLLVALLGIHALLPTLQAETYHVTSSAIRIERKTRPLPRAIPHEMPHPRTVAKHLQIAPQPRPQQPPAAQPRARIAYNPPVHSITAPVLPRAQIDAKTLAAQEKTYAATIAAARAESNPLSISKAEQSPVTTSRANYNLAGSQAQTRRGDGILYPVKRWMEGSFVYYYLRYTVRYPSGDFEAGEVPWPVRYPAGQDPFAQGESEHIPLPGPAPNFVASADTEMKPLISHCYRLREQYCDIMPSPQ
jgi:hypothetical protein